MTQRVRDAVIGLFYLILIAALILVSIMIYNKDFTSHVDVTLHTGSIGSSLQNGSDVKVRGVLVGQVHGIHTDGTGSTIDLQLDPSKAKLLPANVMGQLLPKTLFGERYVNLELPATPSSSTLHSGDNINEDTSKRSVELEQFFADLLPVLKNTEPQKLDAALGELAQGLSGRGKSLRTTATAFGHILHQLAPKVPKLAADFRGLTKVANNYNQDLPQLLDAFDQAAASSQTIVRQQVEVRQLFRAVTSMSNVVGGFVGQNSQTIIDLSADSVPTLTTLDEFGPEIPCISKALVGQIPTVDKALGVGTNSPGVHVILHTIPRVGPYTSADKPTFNSTGGPSCPYVPSMPATSPGGTTEGSAPQGTGGDTAQGDNSLTGTALGSDSSLGVVNAPQENRFIDELMAPTAGVSPSAYPQWASLLLGPALRGAKVTVK